MAARAYSQDSEREREREKVPGRWKTNLGKVLADVLSGGAEIVAERTGIAGLAGALTEELAGNV